MGVLLDVLGSVIIGGTLLLMIMSFNLQMQETSSRIYYTSSMIEHMEEVAQNVNHVFSMAGIGFNKDDQICVTASQTAIKFKTFWNYETDVLDQEPHQIEIRLDTAPTGTGKVLDVIQDGIVYPLGHILFIEDMKLKYYNKSDAATTVLKDIMSAEVLLTFRRDSPWRPDRPLRSNLQLKCYMMNRYLQEGAWD
ncbi:MAG: hypothetical protein PHC50_04230 [Candidatus Cloacimonetes bacterium]|nr:hypothetical protein [Candidatus Cloacimonadota bacterium]